MNQIQAPPYILIRFRVLLPTYHKEWEVHVFVKKNIKEIVGD
jgi:hypothetical protein